MATYSVLPMKDLVADMTKHTMHHLHNSQVEEFLQDSKTKSPITQQHRSPFICVHIL